MVVKIYQVDAFTDEIFSGNPAAVCPLDGWVPDNLMQKIAMENNLAETAFYVKLDSTYEIRWFTPLVEVDLCGHATLAAAYVLFHFENHNEAEINFISPRSGPLKVTKDHDFLSLNFPTDVYSRVETTTELKLCFNLAPIETYKGKADYMLVYENEEQIEKLVPDLSCISKLKARGVIVTAKGNGVDFVSRFFAPQSGIDEDPVTGSAHTTLIPFWSERLGKKELKAIQLSARGGFLKCRFLDNRVEISGQAKAYLKGEIYI